MISKAQIKLVKSLYFKKFRKKHNLFIAEGVKLVNELILSEYKICTIYATEDWQYFDQQSPDEDLTGELIKVSDKELRSLSSLKTPNKVIATVHIPELQPTFERDDPEVVLILDSINDPGNLGTIIRTADWFGIKNIICSPDCTDIYNPKVIQATMGSLFHITTIYSELSEVINSNPQFNSYGAFLNGENIQDEIIKKPAFIIIGNESHGINKGLTELIENKICIPKKGRAESLNAAIATGIILDYFTK